MNLLGKNIDGQLRYQLWDQLRDRLWDQLRDRLRDQLLGQLGAMTDRIQERLNEELVR